MDDLEPLLDQLYRGAGEPECFVTALDLLVARFRCRGGTLFSIDAYTSSTDVAVVSGAFHDHVAAYVRDFAAIDPAPALYAKLPQGKALSTNRMFTPEELRREPFLNEFFLRIGLAETLGGHLFSEKGRFALVGLQRGNDREEFTDPEIADLERLMPHVGRALQLRRAFGGMAMRAAGLEAAVDRLQVGLMLLDRGGTALFVNARMRAIAARGDGFMLDRGGRPLPVDLDARRNLDRLLAKAEAGGLCTVPRKSGGDYVVIVSPAASTFSQSSWDRRGRAETLVIVHDPASRGRDAATLLRNGLHLTEGAARLVAALAADEDLQSFAAREGVTIHTARFHLRTALARTGARSQAELVRIAVRLLRDLAMAE